MRTTLLGAVEQVSPQVKTGSDQEVAISRLGDIFAVGWVERLVMAGKVYTLDLGAVGTGLTGNAAVDADQPEVVIAVDAGYYLIPIEINIDIHTDDSDAYDDVVDIDFIADRSQAQATATATAETPNNLLDGGAAFPGRCWSIVTGNITAPVESDVLASLHYELTQVAAETGGVAKGTLGLSKSFRVPRFLAGACQIVGYVTGTNTPTFMGSIIFGCVPNTWIPVL